MTTIPAEGARATQLEETILAAARDVLAHEGLDALSMRVVADRVGVSATALYHYFDSKQDLVDRVVLAGYQRFDEYLAEAMERHAHGSLERLRAFGEAYIRFALENKAHFQVLFSIRTCHPQAVERLTQECGFAQLRHCVLEAMEEENLIEAEPSFISLHLLAIAHGLVTLELACKFEEHECTPKELRVPVLDRFGHLWSLAVEGLRPRPAGA